MAAAVVASVMAVEVVSAEPAPTAAAVPPLFEAVSGAAAETIFTSVPLAMGVAPMSTSVSLAVEPTSVPLAAAPMTATAVSPTTI